MPKSWHGKRYVINALADVSVESIQTLPAIKRAQIEKNTMTIETPEQFTLFRILQLRAALRLECAGMKHSSGRSVCPIVKKMFAWKGNKETILEKLTKHIDELKGQRE